MTSPYEWVGWLATLLFITSYFLSSNRLRIVQSCAAGLWVVYGLIISSLPVVAANVLILVVATFTLFKKRQSAHRPSAG